MVKIAITICDGIIIASSFENAGKYLVVSIKADDGVRVATNIYCCP